MGDARAAAAEQVELLFSQVHAMRENRVLIEQAVVVVHVRVLGLRKQLVHPLDLALVFGDVRVHVRVVELALQIARALVCVLPV